MYVIQTQIRVHVHCTCRFLFTCMKVLTCKYDPMWFTRTVDWLKMNWLTHAMACDL